MAALLIAYDLNSPGQRHNEILALIKKKFPWAKLSESSYAIATNMTPAQAFDLFKPYLDKNDQLFVIELKRSYKGLGSKEVVDWLDRFL